MAEGLPSLEETVARFIAAPVSLPEEVRAAGRRSLLNMVGTAIGGSGEAAIDRLTEFSSRFGGTATSSLIGRGERTDMLWAADINAAAANIFDFDDTHIPTVIHPSAPVGPALLALAESRASEGRPVSGAALLEAFVLGVEVTCRIGIAAGAAHYSRGWHITSTSGIFGAALASGRLLGLSPPALVDALGNALALCAGSVETLGTMSKSLSVGQAARGGLMAALLAENGIHRAGAPVDGHARLLRALLRPPRSEPRHRRPRHPLGNPQQHLQALSLRRRAQSRDRGLPCAARGRWVLASRDRRNRTDRAPSAAREDRPSQRHLRPRVAGQRPACRRRQPSAWTRRPRSLLRSQRRRSRAARIRLEAALPRRSDFCPRQCADSA